MKKIFLLLLCITPLFVFAQWQTQTIGAPKTIVLSKGISAADSAMIMTRTCFPDTLAANRGGLDTFSGTVIRTCDDSIRMRSNDKTRWLTIGGAPINDTIINIITGGGGDSILAPVIDTTGQPAQRILYGITGNHIGSSQFLLWDIVRQKLLVNTPNAALGAGHSDHFYVNGNGEVSSNFYSGSLFTNSMTLTTDTSNYKPVGINSSTGEHRRFSTWGQLIKPFFSTEDLQTVTGRSATTTHGIGLLNDASLILQSPTGLGSIEVHGASDGLALLMGNFGGGVNQGYMQFFDGSAVNDHFVTLYADDASSNPVITFPNRTGVIALQGDVSDSIAAHVGITGTTDNLLKVSGSNLNTNKTFSVLTFSSTPTWDLTTGYNKTITLTGDAVVSFSNAQSGDAVSLITTQDGTGSRQLTIGSNSVSLNPAASSNTVVGCIYNGTIWSCASGYSNTSGTNTGDVTLAGQTYLTIAGQVITANAVNLSGTHVTGTLAAARMGALTGDVTNSAGSYATTIANSAITNAKVSASAAIAYSKLNLSGSILNADINSSAAIAYSKLNLGTSIVNADISASAAIAYSKLNLTGSIVNADVNSSAAIAYSKLSLTSSVVNADISGSAAIANSKLANSTISGIALGSNLADLTVGSGLQLNSGTAYNGSAAKTISIAPSVGTYATKAALTPSDGLEFFQTNDARNAPAAKYYYLNSSWNMVPMREEGFWYYFNDFGSTSQTVALAPVNTLNNEVLGTGATISFTTANSLFLGLMSTGTATNGYAKINGGQTGSQNAGLKPSTMNMYYIATITSISQLSDGTNSFNVEAGFTSGGTPNPQPSGYNFRYDQPTSTNWLYRNGNGALTSTGVTMSATTPYTLEVFVRSDSVFYWINNVSIASEATVGGTSFYTPYTRIVKTAGTTACTMSIDYIRAWARLQTSRTVY